VLKLMTAIGLKLSASRERFLSMPLMRRWRAASGVEARGHRSTTRPHASRTVSWAFLP